MHRVNVFTSVMPPDKALFIDLPNLNNDETFTDYTTACDCGHSDNASL